MLRMVINIKTIFVILLGLSTLGLALPPKGFRWAPVEELSDEFNDGKLDRKKWKDYHPYWSGRDSRFEKENVSVDDGCLRLKSNLRDGATEVKSSTVKAACVASQRQNCGPGYYEARIKASDLSMTTAFWFQGSGTEIDVIENVGRASKEDERWLDNTMMMNTHFFIRRPNKRDLATPLRWEMPTKARDEFHTYGVWWRDENTIWFYHNNVRIAEVSPQRPFTRKMYMFFDTEVFTWHGWPKKENLQDDSKNTMLVDWVRAWRKAGNINLLKDSDFESGNLKSWKDGWGKFEIVKSNAPGNQYCGYVNNGSLIQKVKLEPKTTYVLAGNIKSVSHGEVSIGVKNHGMEEVSDFTNNNDYEKIELKFTTGEKAEETQIYIWSPKQGYADNMELYKW